MRERLIKLIKEVYTPFEDGYGLYVRVEHQLPEHAFEAIADHLIAEGVIVPPKIVYLIVNKGTQYAFVSRKSPDYMQLYEIKDLKKNGYYLTKEEAEKALDKLKGE